MYSPRFAVNDAMKSSTKDMLRAYLMTDSIAAVLMEALALIALAVFGISEEAFQSGAFRIGASVIIVAAVLATRHVAYLAFCSALKNRYARVRGTDTLVVSVSQAFPGRQLVILHLRLTRSQFELVSL